ncbi:MAG: helix-turn-helix domain-containing protein [Planctomycetota bacterium]|jgi:transposase
MSKRDNTHHRPGAEFFLCPATARQRQYEALRAYLRDGLSAQEAAARFDYSPQTLYSLCRELRAGRLVFFAPGRPGPKSAPKRDVARDRVVALRKRNYSIYDIQQALAIEGVSLSHVAIHQVLREEGFARLPRRRHDERPAVARPEEAEVADIRQLDWRTFAQVETRAGALFVLLPTIVAWGLDRWVKRAGCPGSQMIPALQSILSLLALKLVGKDRISHVMDACFDPGFALFAGLNALPKTTALSTYSYRVTREMTASLLHSYVQQLIRAGLLPGQSFNLDFHAIPYRGNDPLPLEKHYVSQRSRRERSVLVFLVQDGESRVLCYANATVRKDQAAEEILNFVEFWQETRGCLPPHLVFDSRLTTYPVLDRLDKQGILFITLRRRGAAILRTLDALPKSAWRRLMLHGVSRQFRHAQIVESTVHLRGVHRPLRQIAARGLGRDEPTLFLTNDPDLNAADVVERYAHRMLIENCLSENVDFFHLDALSSSIALQVDLDVMLTLIANGLYRDLARRLERFEAAKPKQIFRRFLNTPARISVTERQVRVRLSRRAHHPILLASGALDATPAIPWWAGRRLHLEVR